METQNALWKRKEIFIYYLDVGWASYGDTYEVILWHVTPYNLVESNDAASIIRINDSETILCPDWK